MQLDGTVLNIIDSISSSKWEESGDHRSYLGSIGKKLKWAIIEDKNVRSWNQILRTLSWRSSLEWNWVGSLVESPVRWPVILAVKKYRILNRLPTLILWDHSLYLVKMGFGISFWKRNWWLIITNRLNTQALKFRNFLNFPFSDQSSNNAELKFGTLISIFYII